MNAYRGQLPNPALHGVAATVRREVINVLVGGSESSYSFDRTGRLFGAFVGGRNYRRSLSNRVLCKWRGVDGRRSRRWLDEDEAREFVLSAYEVARAAAGEADPALGPLLNWDWPALQADADRFHQIYRPVGILPPDQYLALVLQATEGCSYNQCTFCDFYRDRGFRVKSGPELAAHIAEVVQFFGPGLALRKSLFLADANALVAPMPRLREWFAVIAAAGLTPPGGLHSFLDTFSAGRKSVAEWQELKEYGLRRVYIGMESGDDGLLSFLRKPGSAAEIVAAVSHLKAAGVAVSVIIMTGAGGDSYAAAHVAGTLTALNAMPLGRGDIIYLSPFVNHAGSSYDRLVAEAGIAALSDEAVMQQEAVLRAGYRPPDPACPPQLARYDIREFIY